MANTVARTFIAEKKLTNAEIKALGTSPFELVAAPGVGKGLCLESYYTIIDTSSGVYASPGGLDLNVGGTAHEYAPTVVLQYALQNAGRRVTATARFDFAEGGDLEVTNENKSMVLISDGGDLTGGHDNNYLIVRVYYKIFPISSTITGNPVQD